MEAQQTSDQVTDLKTVEDYLAAYANPLVPNRSSFTWTVKRHRDELVRCGALILARGRRGHIVHPAKFNAAVLEIHRRAK